MYSISAKEEYFLLFLYIIYEMYVTLKLDDSGCRIHSISDGPSGLRGSEHKVIRKNS